MRALAVFCLTLASGTLAVGALATMNPVALALAGALAWVAFSTSVGGA